MTRERLAGAKTASRQTRAMQTGVSGDLTDEQLMDSLARGEQWALELLYERYARPVFSLALRILGNQSAAAAVTQDTFERVWRYAFRFDPQCGRCATWLLTTTHYLAVDRLGSGRRPAAMEGDGAEHAITVMLAEAGDIAEVTAHDEQVERIRQALRSLPESQQQAIALAYFEGMSHLEIAATLGEPLVTVKTRIQHGMSRLKAVLKQGLGALSNRSDSAGQEEGR